MAVQALLTDQTTEDLEPTGLEMTGPCTVYFRGLSGAECWLEISPTDDAGPYERLTPKSFSLDGQYTVIAYGSYYLRAPIKNVQASTSATVTAKN